MDKIIFKIVKPQGIVYESEIDKITIPTEAGEITVLPDHSPLVSVVSAGELLVHKGKDIIAMAVSGGILEIRPESELYILADTAELATEINIERAEEARQRAEKLLKEQKNVEDIEFTKIQALMEKELNRISIAKKYRK